MAAVIGVFRPHSPLTPVTPTGNFAHYLRPGAEPQAIEELLNV
jgi:hypothetical protein